MFRIDKIIAALIIGIAIVMAAIVIAEPSYADNAWSFIMSLISVLISAGLVCCIIGAIVVIIIVVVALILIFKG